jgi:hypothetical protein
MHGKKQTLNLAAKLHEKMAGKHTAGKISHLLQYRTVSRIATKNFDFTKYLLCFFTSFILR